MKRILIAFFSVLSISRAMANDINWSFPSTPLSAANHNASDPQIAIDANGDLIGAWVENGFIMASTKHLNLNWNTSITLSTATANSPRIVSDSLGNAAAIWLQSGMVMASSKPFTGSWSSPVILSPTGAADPTLAVSSSGDVIAAWARNGNIETSTKLFGGNWGNRIQINSSNASHPHIAIGGTGSHERAVIVWNKISNSLNAAVSSSKLVSGNWSQEVTISDQNHNAGFAHVAVDANGNAAAVWFLYDINSVYSNVTVQSALNLFSKGSWNAPVTLSAPGINNPANLIARVACDSTGNFIALWNTSFDGKSFNIQSAVKPVGQNWTAPTDIVSSNLFALKADLAVTSLGDALALYMFYNGITLNIQSTESDISGFMNNVWSVPVLVSSGIDNGFPRVAATLTGNIINAATLWVSFNGTNNQILASTGSKTLVSPPSDLMISQSVNNFGSFQNFFNTLTWDASVDPNAVGYLIYRNGLFIEQVPANVLQFVDDNQVQNGPVTYGVASVDAQNTHSPIITVNFP